jgi:hypothetical protein
MAPVPGKATGMGIRVAQWATGTIGTATTTTVSGAWRPRFEGASA